MPVFRLSRRIEFPPVHLSREDGLLAVGGDLSVKRLLLAYSMGIFPWYNWDEPVLWWSPDPRLVLFPKEVNISRSLKKIMKRKTFRITLDSAFDQVIRACASIRTENDEGTWIGKNMIDAYLRLHHEGFAHSVEAWSGDKLAGGLYGVSLGRCFFGESMFAYESNASKAAFATLCNHLAHNGFDLIDCQVKTRHLMSFGAREIPRDEFVRILSESLDYPTQRGIWAFETDRTCNIEG
jgi:leucyl/phenylalanyl-tRNA--protein transferase